MSAALVGGALANKPHNGGNAWSRLSWLRGLQRLGVDVAFVEQVDAPTGEQRAWFHDVLGEIPGWLVVPGEPLPDALRAAAADADVLLNIGGHVTHPELLPAPRRRVYLDDDPCYTQLWRLRLDGHDLFFTFGANIGTADCAIPTCGLEWRPTRPPVVLEDWPPAVNGGRTFTTVATWRHPYGRVDGYGQKLDEFRRFIELPRRCGQRFELALDIDPAETPDLDRLAANAWTIVEPPPTLAAFRDYVRHSGAEFSAAQGVYVETHSGWFSDRSVRYLASGKPVVVQETGFSSTLPSDDGLIGFSTLDEAVAGVERVAADYDRHAQAARSLAETWFDSDAIVGALLEDAVA
jgi:hypothetical protein